MGACCLDCQVEENADDDEGDEWDDLGHRELQALVGKAQPDQRAVRRARGPEPACPEARPDEGHRGKQSPEGGEVTADPRSRIPKQHAVRPRNVRVCLTQTNE